MQIKIVLVRIIIILYHENHGRRELYIELFIYLKTIFSPLKFYIAKESGNYKTKIDLEFVNMNQSKFEILREELRDAFSKILKVPKASIGFTLKRVLVKRESSYNQDDDRQNSMIVVVTIETNTQETAKAIENTMNSETLVQRVNDEINESEILKKSGIALERVSSAITEGQDGR